MMNMHSKYDNMNKNEIRYALKRTNNIVISSINSMLSLTFIIIEDKPRALANEHYPNMH